MFCVSQGRGHRHRSEHPCEVDPATQVRHLQDLDHARDNHVDREGGDLPHDPLGQGLQHGCAAKVHLQDPEWHQSHLGPRPDEARRLHEVLGPQAPADPEHGSRRLRRGRWQAGDQRGIFEFFITINFIIYNCFINKLVSELTYIHITNKLEYI